MKLLTVTCILCFAGHTFADVWKPVLSASGGTEDGKEHWGYIDTRPGCHQFYWLYHTYHSEGVENRPLILWLQGGPGASSTGYGNFEIIGPLGLDLQPREATWVKEANVLFIDNPIGAGWSYVDHPRYYTQTTEEITQDLLSMISVIMDTHPELQSVPFYIFGQSYGGKMGAHFAEKLYWEMKDGRIKVNLKGYAMGNSWISPVDSTITWAPMLYWMSILDEPGYNATNRAAMRTKELCDTHQWKEATRWWSITEVVLQREAANVDFYNILNYEPVPVEQTVQKYVESHRGSRRKLGTDFFRSYLAPMAADSLDDLMNIQIRPKLEIIPDEVIWGGQYGDTFAYQEGDFMKPVVDVVASTLRETDLHVIVYQGQLDLICDGKAAMDWVQQIEWEGLGGYMNAERVAYTDPQTGQTEAWYKKHDRLHYHWINNAGHAVPKDAPWPAYRMLDRIFENGASISGLSRQLVLLCLLVSFILHTRA